LVLRLKFNTVGGHRAAACKDHFHEWFFHCNLTHSNSGEVYKGSWNRILVAIRVLKSDTGIIPNVEVHSLSPPNRRCLMIHCSLMLTGYSLWNQCKKREPHIFSLWNKVCCRPGGWVYILMFSVSLLCHFTDG
jgi:hypothetical protein